MAKRQSLPVIVFGILLIALAFLLLNPLATLQVPAISLGSSDTTVSARLTDAERIRSATVARWEAMGEFYSGSTSARPEAAEAADQARWEGAGEFYADSARVADQARWEAMGEFYTSSTSARPEAADIADQARWDAKGAAYEQLTQMDTE